MTISSVFSSLLEPSYRAVLSDLLPREEYSRASGMVNMAGSAKYLISPLLAGFLLNAYDVTLLLKIDILTFFVTILCTGVVRKSVSLKKSAVKKESFFESLREGWRAVTRQRSVVTLIFVSSVMTCFMGTMQILSEPMILDFQSSRVLGIAETVCASGMLFSGILIGLQGIKKGHVRILSLSSRNSLSTCRHGSDADFVTRLLRSLEQTLAPYPLQVFAWQALGPRRTSG